MKAAIGMMVGVLCLAPACEDEKRAVPSDGGAHDTAAQDGGALVDAQPDQAETNGYCPVEGYTACGGDLVGIWGLQALCPEDPAAAAALCEHPYDDRAACTGPGNEAICTSIVNGTLTFNSDGTVDVNTELGLATEWHFTDECLAEVAPAGPSFEERCLLMSKEHLVCTYDDFCSCVGDPQVESDSSTETYTVDGNTLTLGDGPPATYCVNSWHLTLDYEEYHPVSWRYWVLTKAAP